MDFVDQTVLHGDGKKGNCFHACVASLFNVPIDEQPDWNSMAEDQWFSTFDGWLRERNIELLRFNDSYSPDGYYMVSGDSPRGSGIKHCVIYKDGNLAHDPHPSHDGVASIDTVWVFSCLDVSLFFKGGVSSSVRDRLCLVRNDIELVVGDIND